jgi:hypothetical protein
MPVGNTCVAKAPGALTSRLCIANFGSARRSLIYVTKGISVAVSIKIKCAICRHSPRADIADYLGCERA